MTSKDRGRDWSVVGAIVLIVLGVSLLLDQLPFWSQLRALISRAIEFAWPLALIALGVLLLVGSKRAEKGRASGKRLYRSRTDRMIGGVLGGVGQYLGIDPTWLRVIYAVAALLSGGMPLVILYVVAVVLMAEEPVVAPHQPVWPGDTVGTETVQAPPPPPVPHPPTTTPPAPPVPPQP